MEATKHLLLSCLAKLKRLAGSLTERIKGRKLVSVRNLSNMFTCFLFLAALFALNPDRAQAQSASYCDGYARDFAQRNSTGHVAGGAARGAIGGALIGGIVRGGKGAGRGALIGGGVGAVTGSARKSNDYNALYNQAYSNCMRG